MCEELDDYREAVEIAIDAIHPQPTEMKLTKYGETRHVVAVYRELLRERARNYELRETLMNVTTVMGGWREG